MSLEQRTGPDSGRPIRRQSRLPGWHPFVPAAVLLIEIVLRVKLNATAQLLQDAAIVVWFVPGLLPIVPLALRAFKNPQIMRSKGMRLMLASVGVAMAAIIALAISVLVSGQSNGIGQMLLAIIALAGLGMAVLSPFLWLVEKSRSAISRYNSQHRMKAKSHPDARRITGGAAHGDR